MIDIKEFENKIMCADCMDILKQLPDKCIDMILCDLPYGTTACKWDIVIPFESLWEQYKRIRKDNCPIILFGSEPFSSFLRMSNIKEYKYDWIYIKERGTGFARAKKQPLRQTENICVFYKEQPFYDWKGNPLKNPYKHILPIKKSYSDCLSSKSLDENGNRIYKEYDFSTKTNIIYCPRETRNSIHPTQKPVLLFEYLIKTYTNPNELVLDNCSGSGTTAVASLHTGRRFICIEKEKEYFEASVKRLEDERKQLNLF